MEGAKYNIWWILPRFLTFAISGIILALFFYSMGYG